MNIQKYLSNYLVRYIYFLIILPVLFSCSSTIQTILKPVGQINTVDKIINVKEGTLIIKDVFLTKRDNSYFFNMSVTNNTTVDWEYLSFNLKLFDKNGNKITSHHGEGSILYFTPKIHFLDKNKTKYLSNDSSYKLSYEDEKLGQVIYGLGKNIITSYEITLERSKEYYRPKYLFSLIKPKENKNLLYKDEFVDIKFFITTNELGFILKNETQLPMKINWDLVSYVDYNEESHRIIHSGVQYINRNNIQTATVIPPMSKLTDSVFPVDYVEWSTIGKSWNKMSFFPGDISSKQLKGRNLKLFLPIDINGKVVNYQFVFKIDDV